MDCEVYVTDDDKGHMQEEIQLPKLGKGAEIFFNRGDFYINKYEKDGEKRSTPRLRFMSLFDITVSKPVALAAAGGGGAADVEDEGIPF